MFDSTKYIKEFCADSKHDELGKIREFVITNARDFGFSEKSAMQIALAVDEACSNLIQHAFKYDDTQKICIRLNYENKNFIVNILDKATPFDPKTVPSPDMKKYFANFNRGGLGIQIIKKVMDSIEYKPADKKSGSNVLSLVKKLQ